MNIFKFVFKSRGPVNFARRTAQIVSRFGGGPGRMGNRFERFMDVLDDFGVRPTFPITALPMSRNPSFAHRLLERGAELAVHAWAHTDLTSLDYQGQAKHIGNAIQLFRKHSIPFTGFRAPYLHWDDNTMRVVEDYQFRYSSNRVIFWDVIEKESFTREQGEALEKAKVFYNPVEASRFKALPYRRRGFVEIPVSLPDDEILLDRMYVHDAGYLSKVWSRLLEETYKRGELFTLQLHPERIDFFADALRGLMGEARKKKPGVWIATLDQIADWWLEKTQNRVVFVREGTKFKAEIKGCTGTTVYYRADGAERAIAPGTIAVDSAVRPCAGVSPGAPRDLTRRLAEVGYVIETGDAAEDFAVFLGRPKDDSHETLQDCLRRLDECPGPLFRFGTWPHGNRSALAVTGDIDALTVWDFLHRFRGA